MWNKCLIPSKLGELRARIDNSGKALGPYVLKGVRNIELFEGVLHRTVFDEP